MLRGYEKPSEKILNIHENNKGFNIIVSIDMKYIIIAETILYPSIVRKINNIGVIAGERYYADTMINTDHQFYKNISIVKMDADTNPIEKSYTLHGSFVSNIKIGYDNSYFIYCSYDMDTKMNNIVVQYIEHPSNYKILNCSVNMLHNIPYDVSTINDSVYIATRMNNKNSDIIKKNEIIQPIQKSSSKNNPMPQRTFPDVLKNDYECDMFVDKFRSEIIQYSVHNGKIKKLFDGCIKSFRLDSTNKYIMYECYTDISTLVYSDYFGFDVKIYDIRSSDNYIIKYIKLEETMITTHDSTHRYARGFNWFYYNDKNYIMFFEPLDNGNSMNEVKFMDSIILFDLENNKKINLCKCKYRVTYVISDISDGIIIVETSVKNKCTTIRRLKFDNNFNKTYECILFEYDSENLYSLPGSFITIKNNNTESVIIDDENYIYMKNNGHTDSGVYPYIYKLKIDKNKLDQNKLDKIILWKCAENFYQNVFFHNVVYSGYLTFMYSTQTTEKSPSYRLKYLYLKTNIQNKIKTKKCMNKYNFKIADTLIMSDKISYPNIKGFKKENIRYKRSDGLDLTASMYIPPNYISGIRPVIIIAYPREFTNVKNVGQVRSSRHVFNNIRGTSWLYFLAKDYIIIDDCDMPIVKIKNSEPNDTFVEQLEMNSDAIIKYLIQNKYSDGSNIAIVGHSYGAFMVANLLTHTKYFTCGIARSGAYNRTLTPFGFQGEDRILWEASETYLKMSPLLYANKINSPILLIHGELDSNPGTYPIQSERYFDALKGLGSDAELLILPGESHGYECEESVLHSISVCEKWFEKWFGK